MSNNSNNNNRKPKHQSRYGIKDYEDYEIRLPYTYTLIDLIKISIENNINFMSLLEEVETCVTKFIH